VVTGFKVADATESANGVEVFSESNEEVTGALLVGADGVGSMLRHILNPVESSTKTYAGYLSVGLITKDEVKIEMTLHSYPCHQVGIASCGKVNEAATKKSSSCRLTSACLKEMQNSQRRQASRQNSPDEQNDGVQSLGANTNCMPQDADAILAYGPVYKGSPQLSGIVAGRF
jgi:hypothetical protein